MRSTSGGHIYTDVEVRDPVGRRGGHIYGGGWGEAAAPEGRGIHVVQAIPIVAPLLVSTEGPHRRFGVRHQPVHARLLGRPPDVR